MFADLTGRLTAVSNTYGSRPKGRVAHVGEFPLREPADPSLANGAAGPNGYITPWYSRQFSSSDTSHTAVAVDLVYGSQLTGPGPIDNTDWQGATLTGGHGSSGLGEVSAGMALMGQWGQPADAAGQPNLVDEKTLTGQSSHHSAAFHGDTLMEVEVELAETHWGLTTAGPRSPPALLDQMGITLPGVSYLTGSWPSLSGVEPPPGFIGTPMGSGEFSGSVQTPLHFVGIRPLSNRTTATITSHTVPAVTIAGEA